uniref:Ycf21 n=1 Tax=Kuetzingia canaliculata TaxID=228262 RepID=A0A1Z1MPW8_KUECA|nr:hypothetical protein [Kuetzingia canaliculata]ARW67811.1 hypothetical protein [Kuetzingia canaliculata]
MNFYINTFNYFHCICILPAYNKPRIKQKINSNIPVQLQILLINEGSLTRTMQYLTGQIISIEIIQQTYKTHQLKNFQRKMRFVWLETEIYTKLIFARSLWILLQNSLISQTINNNKPIGNSFIKNELDIHKKIHEIYYGYCYLLEKDIKSKHAIWGRKYTLYYKTKSYVTIQEIFSPYVISFFE